MILPDVNVLVYAFRHDLPQHHRYRTWLEATAGDVAPFGLSGVVLSGFLRLVTHPRVFAIPASMGEAMQAVSLLRSRPNFVPVEPGRRHWEIFRRLLDETGVTGNDVADAYIAAIAIEAGCELATADRGFARFPGLRWRDPGERS